jgi:hypothetical protein
MHMDVLWYEATRRGGVGLVLLDSCDPGGDQQLTKILVGLS